MTKPERFISSSLSVPDGKWLHDPVPRFVPGDSVGVRASFVEEADRLVADGVFDNVGRKHFYNVCREHPERCLKSRVRMTLKRREHFRRYMGF